MAKLMVLVADQSHARLYESSSLKDPFVEIEDFSNAVARHHEQDLVSDAPGSSSSPGNSYSHPMGGEQDARQHNLEQFAAMLVQEVSRQLDREQEAKLYLVAPPKFLGVIRHHLPERMKKRLAGELDKNITDVTAAKIAQYVRELDALV